MYFNYQDNLDYAIKVLTQAAKSIGLGIITFVIVLIIKIYKYIVKDKS
jgi:hypothetical protein